MEYIRKETLRDTFHIKSWAALIPTFQELLDAHQALLSGSLDNSVGRVLIKVSIKCINERFNNPENNIEPRDPTSAFDQLSGVGDICEHLLIKLTPDYVSKFNRTQIGMEAFFADMFVIGTNLLKDLLRELRRDVVVKVKRTSKKGKTKTLPVEHDSVNEVKAISDDDEKESELGDTKLSALDAVYRDAEIDSAYKDYEKEIRKRVSGSKGSVELKELLDEVYARREFNLSRSKIIGVKLNEKGLPDIDYYEKESWENWPIMFSIPHVAWGRNYLILVPAGIDESFSIDFTDHGFLFSTANPRNK